MKYLSEITMETLYSSGEKEITKYKLLLPFRYSSAFCDLMSENGKISFPYFFEEDIEFQEILFEAYGDIDEDDFENEIEYIKENWDKNRDIFREILDIFLSEPETSYYSKGDYPADKLSPFASKKEVITLIAHDLLLKEPDFQIKM
ncbi:MAG: hypothetical protein IJC89_03950 [Clostridia bacterium]|nr:hypothetical protein [Clostridia bacterium]